METYRIRGSTPKNPKKLLFPLSFGHSSASLLHILDGHLQGQHDRMNRAAYELLVVHIDLHLEAVDLEKTSMLLEKYKSRFPRHTYLKLGLEEALDLDSIDWKIFSVHPQSYSDPKKPYMERLQELAGSLSSATSRADVLKTFLTRLLVEVARRSDCEGILFGDSTTKLAEKVLIETAKGRGFSLPWKVSDGMLPYGVSFNYPLRDLLKKDLVAFCSLASPPLDNMVIRDEISINFSAASKSATIDDLMAQYFESVEENYPSIVANVVRTSSKLKALSITSTTACGLCGIPVEEGTDGIFGWAGDQNSGSRVQNSSSRAVSEGTLCYGCSRSVNG